MLQRVAFRNIKSVQYCPLRMVLEVQFEDENKIYQYFDVPEDVWYNMKNVSNLDIFFNTQILSRYRMVCRERGKGNHNKCIIIS